MSSISSRISEPFRLGGLFSLATGLLLCLFFVLGYNYFVAIFMANDLIDLVGTGGSEEAILLAVALLAPSLTALWWLRRRREPFPSIAFSLFYLAVSTAICAAYAYSVDPRYVSDFGRMWSAAARMAESSPLPVSGIIEQRALLVAYPVVEMFGSSTSAMEVANSLVFVLIGLFGYMAMKVSTSRRAAQAFALLWLCCFEPVMAVGIPTHDLWGLLFIAAALWIAAELYQSMGASIRGRLPWLALALGVALALAQLQREVGIVLLLAITIVLLWVGLSQRRQRTASMLLIGLIASYVLTTASLGWVGAKFPAEEHAKMNVARLVGFSGSFSTGRFSLGLAMREAFLDPQSVSDEDAKALAKSIFLSDTAEHPVRRVSNIVARLAAIAHPGSQQYFYLSGVPPHRARVISILTLISSLIVFGLAAREGTRFLSSPSRSIIPVTGVMVLFSGGMLIIFCTLSELQPRYAFFMWVTACMIVANGAFHQELEAEVSS